MELYDLLPRPFWEFGWLDPVQAITAAAFMCTVVLARLTDIHHLWLLYSLSSSALGTTAQFTAEQSKDIISPTLRLYILEILCLLCIKLQTCYILRVQSHV